MLAKSDFNISEAILFFNKYSADATFIVPTLVGLNKSIMDATSTLRSYLKLKDIHNYDQQKQSPEAKVILKAFFVTENNLITTTASLYRPKAKNKGGDPRIWFSKLSSYASPNNLLAIIALNKALYIINISNKKIRLSSDSPSSPLASLLEEIKFSQESVANELLNKIKVLTTRGWIQTVTSGDTGIGATLENCLGIRINSNRKPDYKGIEIKAKRIKNIKITTRSNLFAQVPDWNISRLKSSAKILESYGYFRGSIKKLYCTVKSLTPNSQGLMLKVDEANDLLHEVHQSGDIFEDVVTWRFNILRDRLLEKHNETFWVGAETQKKENVEYFYYKKVIHTKSPFVSNFQTLCNEGIITLDHLIKRDEKGKVAEKGPLFKINEKNLELLFPPPRVFDLTKNL